LTLADRWFHHRKAVLNTDLTMAYIDRTAALISEARSRPKKSYPKPFTEEVQLFKHWIANRLAWLDGEIARRFAEAPPIIDPAGGHVAAGAAVSVAKPAGASGIVYYTLNGEDPRLEGGAMNPNARPAESSHTVLSKSALLRARIHNNGECESLRITEIMYHPADPTEAERDIAGDVNLTGEDFEFIEFTNIGTAAINLNLVSFTDGISFAFGDYTLNAGQYAVAVRNEDAFRIRYPDVPASLITGTYAGALDNSGERITLVDAVGTTIHDFAFKDGWYDITDGEGFSLTVRDAAAPVSTWGKKDGWRPSAAAGGSPGYDDSAILTGPGAVGW